MLQWSDHLKCENSSKLFVKDRKYSFCCCCENKPTSEKTNISQLHKICRWRRFFHYNSLLTVKMLKCINFEALTMTCVSRAKIFVLVYLFKKRFDDSYCGYFRDVHNWNILIPIVTMRRVDGVLVRLMLRHSHFINIRSRRQHTGSWTQ